MIRTIFVAAALFVLSAVTGLGHSPPASAASVRIEPSEGQLSTSVELSSQNWAPNTEVRIMAAPSLSVYTPADAVFVGPVAVTESDSTGSWSVQLQIESAGPLVLPDVPGFAFYRALSDGQSQGEASIATVGFSVIVEGERPNGSGGFNIRVSGGQPGEFVFVGWRSLGEETFFSSYGPVALPFKSTVAGIPDGEYEAGVATEGPLPPSGDEGLRLEDATVCFGAVCFPDQTLLVKGVTVSDGEFSEVEIVVGEEAAGSMASDVGLPLGSFVVLATIVGLAVRLDKSRRRALGGTI